MTSASSSCSVSSAMPHHLSPALSLPLPLHTPLALPILGVGCPANMSTSHCSVCCHVMPPSLFLSQVTSDVAGEVLESLLRALRSPAVCDYRREGQGR
eukprot:765589-Hanusia_phi.AAC.1